MRAKCLCLAVLLALPLAFAESQEPVGTVRGTVVQKETQEPLPGVTVMLVGTRLGAATDVKGVFRILRAPVGSYNVSFQGIGFEKVIRPDVLVRSDRVTFLTVEMAASAVEMDTLRVETAYFQKEDGEPLSAVQFNSEEIRRAPGSVGDISRVLSALPSVAQVADNANDLMVRGGSPAENGFYVDNIPIPNINHFPVQGSTGGPIGMLNVDFIEGVRFHTGGFSAAYGDRLSSIVDIRFREGNRDAFDVQVDGNMSGFGVVAEGPISRGKGSWLISGKRSYLDLITGAIGTGVAPRFGDVQGKLSYDINPQNRISVLNVFGGSGIRTNPEEARKQGEVYYGDYNARQNTMGINWRVLWGSRGYSNTSVSQTFVKTDDLWNDLHTGAQVHGNKNMEGAFAFRNVTFFQANRTNRVEFGVEAKRETADYDYFFAPDTSRLGEYVPGTQVKGVFHATQAGGFVSYTWNPLSRLTTTFGLRGDYSSNGGQPHLSPRFSASWKAGERMSLNAAAGLFHQRLPAILRYQDAGYKKLNDPRATHVVLGVDYMLTPDTKLTVEVYDKEYRRLPLDPDDPTLSVLDDGRMFSYFRRYSKLEDRGRAYSRGVELLIQKKLAKDLYGMVSATAFRCRYRDDLGQWRDRLYDNRYLFTVVGGYRPGRRWEFSMRWNYAGGVPYTPFDIARSTALNTGIIDLARLQAERYPAYHSLNLRVDRRFYFQKSSIVTYLSLWNAYNRKNIAAYYWNEVEDRQDTIHQWSLLPLFGVEYEF